MKPVNMPLLTRCVVGGSIVLLLAWEGIAIASGQPGATISEAVWDADTGRPYLPYFAGFLCGHFFWQIARTVSVVSGNALTAVETAKDTK